MHHYDLSDLRLLLNIAEEGSLSHGAEASHMAPSSASLRIKSLEEEFGCALLTRQSRGVALTAAGERLLLHARKVLEQTALLESDLRQYDGNCAGKISLYANSNAIWAFLPDDLAGFLSNNPLIHINLEEHTSDDVVAAIATGRADVGIAAWQKDVDGVTFFRYRQDRKVLIVARKHGFARRKHISFGESLGESFIVFSQSGAMQSYLSAQAAALGSRIDTRIEAQSLSGLLRLVESGAGIGVVSQTVLGKLIPASVVRIPLTDAWAARDLRICVRRRHNWLPESTVLRLVEHLRTRSSLQVRPSVLQGTA